MAEKRLLQVSLGEENYQDLDALSRELGVTKSEVVRHSLEVYKLLRESKANGAEVLIKKGDDVQRLARI